MRRDKKEVRSGQEAGFSAEPTRIDMQSSTRSLDETARQTSTGRRIVGVLASGLGRRSSSHYSPTDSPNSPSLLAKRQFAFPILAVLAVAALGLWLLLPGGALRAQDAAVEYAENGKDPVATFTATDPEGATPITWSLATAAQVNAEGDDLADADNADAEDFMIDKDGMLKFNIAAENDGSSPGSPDFENPQGAGSPFNNTYKVVVVACDVALVGDACPVSPDGEAGYHKVTVKVTNVNEPGTVTLATSTPGGTPQYLVGATLTAMAKDGDITDGTQTFTDDVPTEVNGVTWRWYRGATEITGSDAQDNTYTLLQADAGQHIRAVAFYVVAGNVDQEMAEKTTDYPVLGGRIGPPASSSSTRPRSPGPSARGTKAGTSAPR